MCSLLVELAPPSKGKSRRFRVPSAIRKPRLFALDALGKAMRLEGYAPRGPRRPVELQQALFAYHEAWG
jgi:hypothetical protein